MLNISTQQLANEASKKLSLGDQVDFKISIFETCLELKQECKLSKDEIRALFKSQIDKALTNMVD